MTTSDDLDGPEVGANARCTARRLHLRFGVRAAEHVRIEAIAARLGVTIEMAPLIGADAQLYRRGRRARIVLAERITDPASRRFSIAHELGHLMLGHASRWDPLAEREANAFAAELLMPSALLRHRCEEARPTLELAGQIAREFRVSIVASAIRVVELASAPCAVALVREGAVKWSVTSPPFGAHVPRGWRVAPSCTTDAPARTERSATMPRIVSAAAWLPHAEAGTLLVEHSIRLRMIRSTLSMLRPAVADAAVRSVPLRRAA